MAIFIEYADTAEEMRDVIVALLRREAQRHDPAGVHGKRLSEREAARRQVLNDEAEFIERLVIRPMTQPTHVGRAEKC